MSEEGGTLGFAGVTGLGDQAPGSIEELWTLFYGHKEPLRAAEWHGKT